MTEPRMVSHDDPAVAPVLVGLEQEYRSLHGEVVDGEIELYDAAEFAPPMGAFLVVEAGSETVAGDALRLQTGDLQTAAISLYHSSGLPAHRALRALSRRAALPVFREGPRDRLARRFEDLGPVGDRKQVTGVGEDAALGAG